MEQSEREKPPLTAEERRQEVFISEGLLLMGDGCGVTPMERRLADAVVRLAAEVEALRKEPKGPLVNVTPIIWQIKKLADQLIGPYANYQGVDDLYEDEPDESVPMCEHEFTTDTTAYGQPGTICGKCGFITGLVIGNE